MYNHNLISITQYLSSLLTAYSISKPTLICLNFAKKTFTLLTTIYHFLIFNNQAKELYFKPPFIPHVSPLNLSPSPHVSTHPSPTLIYRQLLFSPIHTHTHTHTHTLTLTLAHTHTHTHTHTHSHSHTYSTPTSTFCLSRL